MEYFIRDEDIVRPLLKDKGYNILFDLTTSLSLIVGTKTGPSQPSPGSEGASPSAKRVRGLRRRLSPADRSKLIIKNPLTEIIIGLLLGDGHIQKRTVIGNSRFMYGQSSLRAQHLNYFNHVLGLFNDYISKDFILKEKAFKNKITDKEYRSVNFATLSLPCFNYYRSIFYQENLKIVPLDIANLLTPRGLAYWIMDDGSLQNKGLHLNTYGFTAEDILKLKLTLENLFGENSLKCSIHKHPKGGRIYIWEESMELLRNNISQYMLGDMLYKISA